MILFAEKVELRVVEFDASDLKASEVSYVITVPKRMREGVIPRLLRLPLRTRKQLKSERANEHSWSREQRQMYQALVSALKLSCNCLYGVLASTNFSLNSHAMASVITKVSRFNLQTVIRSVQNQPKSKMTVIRGDSVAGMMMVFVQMTVEFPPHWKGNHDITLAHLDSRLKEIADGMWMTMTQLHAYANRLEDPSLISKSVETGTGKHLFEFHTVRFPNQIVLRWKTLSRRGLQELKFLICHDVAVHRMRFVQGSLQVQYPTFVNGNNVQEASKSWSVVCTDGHNFPCADEADRLIISDQICGRMVHVGCDFRECNRSWETASMTSVHWHQSKAESVEAWSPLEGDKVMVFDLSTECGFFATRAAMDQCVVWVKNTDGCGVVVNESTEESPFQEILESAARNIPHGILELEDRPCRELILNSKTRLACNDKFVECSRGAPFHGKHVCPLISQTLAELTLDFLSQDKERLSRGIQTVKQFILTLSSGCMNQLHPKQLAVGYDCSAKPFKTVGNVQLTQLFHLLVTRFAPSQVGQEQVLFVCLKDRATQLQSLSEQIRYEDVSVSSMTIQRLSKPDQEVFKRVVPLQWYLEMHSHFANTLELDMMFLLQRSFMPLLKKLCDSFPEEGGRSVWQELDKYCAGLCS